MTVEILGFGGGHKPVAVEHQLGLLCDLPDPHGVVPTPRRHAALPAQTVQTRDGVLVPEAATHNHDEDGRHATAGPREHWALERSQTLTGSPRRRFRPRSTP